MYQVDPRINCKNELIVLMNYLLLFILSSNEDIFKSVAPIYNQALKNSGFNEEIKYEPRRTKRTRRPRKVIYFNPPWDDQIRTNIGGQFLRLVDQHFPPGSELHSIFNQQKLKISY